VAAMTQPPNLHPPQNETSTASLMDSLAADIELPRRTAYGSAGKPIKLSSNHYMAKYDQNNAIQQVI
jgi:hypothetical protein